MVRKSWKQIEGEYLMENDLVKGYSIMKIEL
ncbi:MAG: hypothetical protein CM1200mP10_11130 [Candidatus Neomarinimicrobiota bacterium]|nr:MAG: hypothetical protein CM1200mP10_11130 [Candidatus Neomarinimicrobiota bacterium]